MADTSMADLSVCNSTAKIIDMDAKEEDSKGCFKCFGSIKVFTGVLSLLACVNGAIAASYLPSVLTTIEQKFQLDSSMSGLIVSSYEIGATIAVIFVSYIGHHGHIPGILGWGTFIIAIGSAVFSIPHFISPVYSKQFILEGLGSNTSTNESSFCEDILGQTTPSTCTEQTFTDNKIYIAIFILAQTLIGIGSSPILTLGLSYIDNHVSRTSSGHYLGLVYAASILGSVIGFGCGAAMLEVFVDTFSKYSSVFEDLGIELDSQDDRWLGAWWAGFILFAILMCLIAPWLCMFPKSMNKPDKTISGPDADDAIQNPTAGLTSGKLSELPKSLLLLIKNPVYMLLNFASVFEMTIVTGFLTFAPKYLETQFFQERSNASLITGGVAVPAAVLGTVSVGFIIKKFKIGELGAMNSILILNIIAICGFGAAFSLGCSNIDIAGVTAPYYSNETIDYNTIDLDKNCNERCDCNNNIYEPVCAQQTQLTYISYCHAGCTSNTQCSCVNANTPVDTVSIQPGPVTYKACKSDCKLMPAYLAILAVVSFAMAGTKTPISILTLRCVTDELKSFGLGIQVMIIRLLALLPAPIIFGAIIDSSCLWWKTECGEQLNCLMYNNRSFTLRFQGISLGLQLAGTLMFFLAWVILRQNVAKEQKETDDSSNFEVKVTHL